LNCFKKFDFWRKRLAWISRPSNRATPLIGAIAKAALRYF
jgi:hypothetical protein